jgi:membrane fusion protein (multidrug efflux system)
MNPIESNPINRNGKSEPSRLHLPEEKALRPLTDVLPETTAPSPVTRNVITRQWLIRGALLAVGLTALVAALTWYVEGLGWEGTDDAFVEGHVLEISAKISNQVRTVLIDDNQLVKKGDLLVKIDDRDYRVQFDEAQANEEKAKNDFERVKELLPNNAISRQDYDAAKAALDVASARLAQAKLNLEYTEIRAPEDGKVTRKNVEPGDYLEVGQTLCAIVPQHFWVLANYKETQLADMRVGQKAIVWVDGLPGRKFAAHVDSLQSGTGSRFSLLPPENATGNYVKVVQRIPVKIVFDEPADVVALLAPGMSVQPEVRVK